MIIRQRERAARTWNATRTLTDFKDDRTPGKLGDRLYSKPSGGNKTNMTYLLDQDQDQRQEQYEAIEEIYLSGITDAADGRFPQMAEVLYLQGYAKGMVDYPRREVMLPIINTESKEFPLVCHQCYYLNNGICSLKSIPRSSTNYACDRIKFDCPF